MIHYDMVQGTPEWHAWRKSGCGGSDVASVLGVNPYGGTPYTVFLEKTGRSKGFQGNDFTEHGKKYESAALKKYHEIVGGNFKPVCATHDEYSCCLVSLDGYDSGAGVEIKCPKGSSVLDSALRGRVSPFYVPQVQYQFAVAGLEVLDFFVYHVGRKTERIVPVPPKRDYQEQIINQVVSFWNNHVLTDIPPALAKTDVKVVEDPLIQEICFEIETNGEKIQKHRLDFMKERVVRLAKHPKVRCGNVQITEVLKNGIFSFYKHTVVSR